MILLKFIFLECWDENENFFKIGRTFNTVKQRFFNSEMPYNYKVLQLFEFKKLTQENANKSFDLEAELKRLNKQNKYVPKQSFKGMEECYSSLNLINMNTQKQDDFMLKETQGLINLCPSRVKEQLSDGYQKQELYDNIKNG